MTNRLLQRVSLTGVDDNTSLLGLEGLTARYPFVEWAVLYTPHNEGAPRNPGATWRRRFFAEFEQYSAVHLCGSLAFQQLLEGTLPAEVLKAQRMQLNVNARRKDFTDDQVLAVFARALEVSPAIILQYHPDSAALIERYVAELSTADRARVHVLMDSSKGTGVSPASWLRPAPLAEHYVGFAGNLGPANIRDTALALQAFGKPFWLDMETGIRTDNELDKQKAAMVLDNCKELV